jgi:hypothetical protein
MTEVSWSELQSESDLFRWFHLVESGRARVDNLTWVTVAPEAVADSVRLRFGLDDEERVPAFQVAIDRAWLDGEATAMANAGDLVKSVVECFAHADPLLRMVANDLQAGSFGASRSPVITRGAPPEPEGGSDIAALVDVLTSAGSPLAQINGQRVLSAANIRVAERVWFVLGWGAAPESPDRW